MLCNGLEELAGHCRVNLLIEELIRLVKKEYIREYLQLWLWLLIEGVGLFQARGGNRGISYFLANYESH